MDIPVTVHHHEHKNQEPTPELGNHDQGAPEESHRKDDEPREGTPSRTVLFIVVILVIAAGVWLAARNQGAPSPFGKKDETPELTELASRMLTSSPAADAKAVSVQNDWLANIADITFTHSGALADVSGTAASGAVGADVITGVYHLYATFTDLPAPADGSFYEGWVVRREPLSVTSAGKAVIHNNQYVNAYLSRTNLLDHDQYVLTLELSDGNPAPGQHILEGTIAQKQ